MFPSVMPASARALLSSSEAGQSGTLVVTVHSANGLRAGLSEAFVRLKLGGVEQKTKVARESLEVGRVAWNETFEFRGTLGVLADATLAVSAYEHDGISRIDDSLGETTVALGTVAVRLLRSKRVGHAEQVAAALEDSTPQRKPTGEVRMALSWVAAAESASARAAAAAAAEPAGGAVDEGGAQGAIASAVAKMPTAPSASALYHRNPAAACGATLSRPSHRHAFSHLSPLLSTRRLGLRHVDLQRTDRVRRGVRRRVFRRQAQRRRRAAPRER